MDFPIPSGLTPHPHPIYAIQEIEGDTLELSFATNKTSDKSKERGQLVERERVGCVFDYTAITVYYYKDFRGESFFFDLPPFLFLARRNK